MADKIYIGIDLGGTKILTGAISEKGKVLCVPVKVPTNGYEQSERIIQRITSSVETILERLEINIGNIAGIGIGTTGPLDIKTGIILECPQLPTMNYFPLKETIANYFNTKVFINNDANCLIYGETIFGAGKSKKNVLGFTLGTGFGAAIIINGKILNGATQTAGEIWTSPYKSGIIEDYISGKGVSRIYKSVCGKDMESDEIFKLAENNDKDALKTWKIFGEHLAYAMAWSINILDPEIVILGGSISNAGKFFLKHTEKQLRKNICEAPAQITKIVLPELGDYAGFIGAAALAL